MIRNSLFNMGTLHRLFFAILIVLLPTQFGLHFWPEWSTVLGRRIDYLSPTLYLTDIFLILTLVFWCIDVIKKRKVGVMNQESRSMNHGKTLVTIVQYSVFSILVVVNIATSLSPAVSIYFWLRVLEFGLLFLYIIKTVPSLFVIQTTLFIAVFYSSIIAIFQFILQHSIGGIFWFLGERTFSPSTPGIAQIPIFLEIGNWKLDFGLMLRAYGTFPHPNVLGGFLAVTIPLLISVIASETKQSMQRLPRLFYGLAMTMGILALFLTFSRSAWVVGGIGSIISFLHSQKKESRIMKYEVWKYITPAVFVIFLYSLFIILNSRGESVIVRLALNESAISIWKQHPWFGVGLGNFIPALPSVLPSKFIYFLQPVHNIYLLLLSELGLVGISLICLSVYFYMNHELRITNNGKKKKIILHASLFMLLLLGLVDHYPLTVQQGQLLLTLLLAMRLMY